jgi:MarR family transcriptional regulator for hemolysin
MTSMDQLHENFAIAVHQTAHQWRIGLDRRLKPFGLSQSTWRVLLTLHHASAPLSQHTLADCLGVDGASVVRLIDKLESDGLVRRGLDPQDRRVRLITLTERGQEAIVPFKAAAREFARDLLAVFPEEELASATSVLTQVLHQLESLDRAFGVADAIQRVREER